ncbi:MAG: 50S ribosomal protein L9 [Patescibacteria group bacterium]
MKVIILKTGEVKDVADGYARNYLLPNKLAVVATASELKKTEERKKKYLADLAKKKAEEEKVIGQLKDILVKIEVNTNDEGTMFAALADKEIIIALEKQYQIKLPTEWIEFKEPIKQLGDFVLNVKTGAGLKAKLKIQLNKKQ